MCPSLSGTSQQLSRSFGRDVAYFMSHELHVIFPALSVCNGMSIDACKPLLLFCLIGSCPPGNLGIRDG